MTQTVPADAAGLLRRAYIAFNARRVEMLLSDMTSDVDWPDLVDGGRAKGRSAVRAYWKRQFDSSDPRVEPKGMSVEPDGRIAVDVHQVIRTLDGEIVDDQMVCHVYTMRDGLVARMDVREV
jgi:hypothetical protein